MKIYQFAHQLNNTELGRTGTKDWYVYVCKETVPLLDFIGVNTKQMFFYKRDAAVYGELFFTHIERDSDGKKDEYRISGCKKFFEAGNVNAGDSIVLERVDDVFWVDFVIREDVVAFNKVKTFWQCRNEDRLASIVGKDLKVCYSGVVGVLRVSAKGKQKKRTQIINVYELKFNGQDLNGDGLNLFGSGAMRFLSSNFKDKVSKIEWSDDYE